MSFSIQLEPCPTQCGWFAYRIPVSEFPLPPESRLRLREFYRVLDLRLAPRLPHRTAFLQYNQLTYGRSGYTLAESGKDWMPDVGLGYEPHKPPPTLWTARVLSTVYPIPNLDVPQKTAYSAAPTLCAFRGQRPRIAPRPTHVPRTPDTGHLHRALCGCTRTLNKCRASHPVPAVTLDATPDVRYTWAQAVQI